MQRSTDSTRCGYASTNSTEAKTSFNVFDPCVLYFERFALNWFCLDWFGWNKNWFWMISTGASNVLAKSTEAKLCLIVFVPSVLKFVRPGLNWLCFDQLDCSKKVFDCVRPKRATFRPTRLELFMFRLTRLLCFDRLYLKWLCFEQSRKVYDCVRPNHALFDRLDLIWLCFDKLDWSKNVIERVRPLRAMFWPIRSELVMFGLIRLKQKLGLIEFDPSEQCFDRIDWKKTVFDCVRPQRANSFPPWPELFMFRPTRI